MTLLGRLLYGVRAGAHRSPLAGPRFDAPGTIIVTSTAFADGGAMPPSSAGKTTSARRCAVSSCRVGWRVTVCRDVLTST